MESNVEAVELRELWRRCKVDGDERARERLVVTYSPLVKYVAGRMASSLPTHVEEADLVSYGLLGLIGAIERYEPEREIKFETFAVSRIKGAVIDELRSLDWVPRSVRAQAREIEKAHGKLENALQRTPTEEEMAEELDMDLDEFRGALLEIASSSVLALDDLWTVADAGGGRSPGGDRRHRAQGPPRRDDRGASGPRAAGDRPLLLREPHPARDRGGARGHRIARVPTPHEGGAGAALEPADRGVGHILRLWGFNLRTGSGTSP